MENLTISLEAEWIQRLQQIQQQHNLSYEEVVKSALQRYLTEIEVALVSANDPLIGLFDFDEPNLAAKSEEILQSEIVPLSGWTIKS